MVVMIYKQVHVPFFSGRLSCEKMESKESEVSGRWYTEEAMKKEGKWTKTEIKSIIQYCRRFPESLCRCTCDSMPGWGHISALH